MKKQYIQPQFTIVTTRISTAIMAASDFTITKNDEKTVSTGDAKGNTWDNDWDDEEW